MNCKPSAGHELSIGAYGEFADANHLVSNQAMIHHRLSFDLPVPEPKASKNAVEMLYEFGLALGNVLPRKQCPFCCYHSLFGIDNVVVDTAIGIGSILPRGESSYEYLLAHIHKRTIQCTTPERGGDPKYRLWIAIQYSIGKIMTVMKFSA